MSTPQKPKIIRKENIFKRLRSWPLDLLLGLSESIELMNLESIFNESGTVFAILFNAAYISIKFYRDGAFGDPEFITFVQESHLGHIPSSYFSFKAIFSVQLYNLV